MRNIYSVALNILQSVVMGKLSNKKIYFFKRFKFFYEDKVFFEGIFDN